LVDRSLSEPARRRADQLADHQALFVVDHRDGLIVRSRQHVGVVQLDDLRISVRPKVATSTLWTLVEYGLGLDAPLALPPTNYELAPNVPDLVARMMLLAARRLRRDGVSRGYIEQREWLTTPRGRPDLATLARHQPLTRAALPCRHHAFTTDIVANRAVLAALGFARRSLRDPRLRSLLHQEHEAWRSVCRPVDLDHHLLERADRQRTRLLDRYADAHRLARFLLEGLGPDELVDGQQPLPGLMWNMATLFERAVARFLGDHLEPPLSVTTQHRLRELFSVVSGPARRPPSPRPDLVAYRGDAVTAVLDTKYRDLSATSLPREILYQMSVYSLAFGGARPVPAIVLYAVPDGTRTDSILRLNVEHGAPRVIVLRAVGLDDLAHATRDAAAAVRLARSLVALPTT
jgi:5-methylcytosine-specific restriction enzyme subunit McrC